MTSFASLRGEVRRAAGSSAIRAVATLSGGQFLAAIVPFLAAPVLGRLYAPQEYGPLATYMAIAQLIATVGTFQLQQGIIAERSERRAESLVRVCMMVAAAMSTLSLVVGLALFFWMAGRPGYEAARAWMLMLPITTLAGGTTAPIVALANRRGRFGAMARLPVVLVATTVTTSIALGFLGWSVDGLFTAYFVGQAVSTSCYLLLFVSMRSAALVWPSRTLSFAMIRRHRRFAYYTLPSEFIGSINQQMPVLALSAIGAMPLLGAFARARQLLAAPMMLIGSSIAMVFRQRAAAQYREMGSCRRLYVRTMFVLLAIGALPTLVLIGFAPSLFELFLGPKWGEAGEVARVLAPMLLLQLVCSPLSTVFYFAERQSDDLILMASAFLLVAASAALAWMLVGTGLAMIAGYAISWTTVYLAYIYRGWMIAGGRNAQQ